MSPILLRPIREQFEHDRVIRQLQGRLRRRFSVAINPGQEETASVRAESRPVYPDLVLTSTEHGRRLHGVVEVETTESVNLLEAMAQWAHFAKIRGAFYLYVPAGAADVARRLCEDNRIAFTEIWAYYAIGRQVRFSMVHRSAAATRAAKARKTKATAKATMARKTKATAKATMARKTKATAKATMARKTGKPRKASAKEATVSKGNRAKGAKQAKKSTKARAAKPAKTSRTTRKAGTSTRAASRRTAKAVRKTRSSKTAVSPGKAKRQTAKRSSVKRP